MKIEAIKKQLSDLDQSKPKKSKEEKKDTSFKPTIGKQVIRVVPNLHDPDGQFQAIKVYYGITHKVMASPANWGEKDPIEEFIKQLRSANDREKWLLSKKLESKVRIYTPVIDRAEGDTAEVKLWGFGKTTWQDFLNLADDSEIGDFTDINSGRDIKLTTVGPEVTKTDYNKTTIQPALSSSPLSKDKKLVKYWLENQPNILDQFKRFSYDEVKEALRAFLTPTDEIGSDEEDVTAEMPNVSKIKEDMAKAKKYGTQTSSKTNNADKFDALFEEEENE